MEVCSQHEFVDFRIVEEFNEQVAQRIYSVKRSSQDEYARQIIDHIVQYFLVFGLRQFD